MSMRSCISSIDRATDYTTFAVKSVRSNTKMSMETVGARNSNLKTYRKLNRP
jgi:hypothetical protein